MQALEALTRAGEQLKADHLEVSRLAFRAHIAQGLHWRRRGELDRAEAAAASAEALLARLGLAVSMEATDLLNLRTLLAYSRQDLQATLRWARAELEMLERLGQGGSADAMSAWSSQGATLSQLGRHGEARVAYEAGLRIADANPGRAPFGRQGLLNNVATEHLAQRRTRPRGGGSARCAGPAREWPGAIAVAAPARALRVCTG